MESQLIQEKLKNLKSKEDLQELFNDLNFDYSDNDEINWLDNLITSKIKEKVKYINIVNNYKKFNVFYCKLKIDNLYKNRSIQRDIAKKVTKSSDCLIVFANKLEDMFRIVYVDFLQGNNLKITGYTISKEEKLRTAAEQLAKVEIQSDISELEIKNNIKNAFKIEPVTKKFFEVIKKYVDLIINSYGNYLENNHQAKAFALQFFNRLLFLKYIEKKKWLNNNINFLSLLKDKYKNCKSNNSSFYTDVLNPLFFYAFSKNEMYYPKNLPEHLIGEFKDLPYLNGGLFEKNELDKDEIIIEDDLIFEVFNEILNKYNFTVTEDTPFDREIAIDPEMLGLIYEGIVNEEERSGSGIFYTPRIEVYFMCKKSILHYLENETGFDSNKLIKLIFSDFNKEDNVSNIFTEDEKEIIYTKLISLKAADPACGSGAFLIGMLQNILDIIAKLKNLDLEEVSANNPDYLYSLKKDLIEKVIYGVDIKPWAAQLAELRLWLYLIWDYETNLAKLMKEPLLPSLDFKIRQGDSLVSDIEGCPIVLRNVENFGYISPEISKRGLAIVDLKSKFYKHKDLNITKKLIVEKEFGLIRYILNGKLQEIKLKLDSFYDIEEVAETQQLFNSAEQQKFDFKNYIKKRDKEEKELLAEEDRITRLINNIEKVKEKNYFIWEIDFADIFFGDEKGGFDIIIGNPPYVRQEEIAPPLLEKEKISPDIKRKYKERLINNITNIYGKGKISKFNRKSDYYVYFYFVSLSLLKEGGIFTFINSTSWLDVGYGTFLQEFLLNNFKIIDIHDNEIKRSFKSADINTIIISIEKPESDLNISDNLVKFVNHKVAFEESINVNNIKSIYNSRASIKNNFFRLHAIEQSKLFEEGLEQEGVLGGKYIGSKWGGKYLRAPDIYFKILEKGKGKLVRLGDIADIRRGFTTGANEFFYLTDEKIKKWGIEEEFLKLVIKSPRECKSIMVNTKYLKYKVFLCDKPKSELNSTNALKYIEWGEQQNFHKRPSCINRKNWYELVKQEIAFCSYPMVNNNRLIFALNNGLLNDADLVGVYPIEYFKDKKLLFSLNSTYNMLNMELAGISNLGEGAIKQNPIYIKNFSLIINPDLIKLEKNSDNLFKRRMGSIFLECGFDSNFSVRYQKPNPLPDRKALDDIIFDILDLTEEERKEVYWSVCELVQNRLKKAGSV